MSHPIAPLSCFQCREKKLKCDRNAPCCGRCQRLAHPCDYPLARKKVTGKRKQVRELEAKLAELESKLNAVHSNNPLWGPIDGEENAVLVMEDIHDSIEDYVFEDPSCSIQTTSSESFSDQHASSGLAKELSNLYFERQSHCSPMIHRFRYMESLSLPPQSQPPLCLQCIIMALGADASDNYGAMATPLYERARAYAKMDESNEGANSISVAHVQCWDLIANYEAQQSMFSKASASFCQSARIAQLLQLHCLDRKSNPSRLDIIEVEEQCRTWWVIFISDRLMCATTGLPAVIYNRDVDTPLPVSDKAFIEGREEETGCLESSLNTNPSNILSELSARVQVAHLVQQSMEHTSFASQVETSPEKASTYWDRHRELDNELSLLLARLPTDLRSHQYARSQSAAAVNAQIHTAIMTLHRTRICLLRAEPRKASTDQSIRHSQERALAGAEEIAHILRMTTDLKTTFKNPILNFSIYLACLVLIEDFLGNDRQQSRDTACFLSSILASVGEKNSVAESLYNQIRDNMMSVGISIPEPQKSQDRQSDIFASKMGQLLTNVAFRLVHKHPLPN
uniref:Zn(2)-C6 fungal-type domain-containing protein n=1 Tax=Bionectria ochroleuca TaxID=29856 RepID=A0A0B7K7B1_BIOOC